MMPSFTSVLCFLTIVFVLNSSTRTAAVVVYDYNRVRYEHMEDWASLKAVTFTGDTNSVALGNIVLGIARPQCMHLLDSAAFKGSQRHAGGGALESRSLVLTTEDESIFPFQLNGCAELFFYRMHDPLDAPSSRLGESELSHGSINEWILSQTRAEVHVKNDFSYPVDMWWYEENVEPRIDGHLMPGGEVTIGSFLGHVFVFKPKGQSTIVDYFVVDDVSYTVSASNRLTTCSVGLPEMHHLDGSFDVDLAGSAGMGTFTHNELIDCDDMATRFEEFSHRVWYDKRLGLNYVQPQLVPNVTMNGFELRRLPEETYEWLKAWFDREQYRNAVDEENVGPCMNIRAAQSIMTHLPEFGTHSKQRLSEELIDVLKEWYGGELILTSIYGVRKYTNESVLRMHVDTANTHVVSAIINVDQEVDKASGDEDWPLLILDHDGNEHTLVMRPGDLVLYESAKLLHGRPTPLRAKSYSNLFIHYMPPQWDYTWV